MKITKTYSLYSAFIILIAIIVMFGAWTINKNMINSAVKQEKNNVYERFQAVLALESTLLKKTDYDYSMWDELVNFVNVQDKTWSDLNLVPIIQTFNASYVLVFNNQKKLVYSHLASTAEPIELDLSALDTSIPQFKEFFHHEHGKFIQFFLAPIHASDDIKRIGKPLGFLLLGRDWDTAFFNTLTKITLGEIYISDLEKKHLSHNTAFHIPLKSLDNTVLGYLELQFTPLVLNFIENLQNTLILSTVLVGIFVMLSLSFITKKLIFNPIKDLASTLKTHDLNPILLLIQQKNELGEMAQLIYEHEKQTQLLEHYKEAIDENTIVTKTDKRGIITYVNEQFILISGYSSDELIGKSHNIVRHPDNPSSLFEDIWQNLKLGQTWKGVIKNQRKDGSAYYVKTVIMPLYNSEQNIEEFIAIRHDVSELFEEVERLGKEALTGLPGRKILFDSIEKSQGSHLAILNISDFSNINKLYGQYIGDLYLKQVVQSLQKIIDSNLSLFHLQGDEFAIFTTNIGNDTFIQQCKNITAYFAHNGITIEEKRYDAFFKIGIANGYKNLYNRAEMAIKEARELHQNYVIYDDNESFEVNLKNDALWHQKIRNALDQKRFTIFLQEIVPYKESPLQRKKYEALIRLIDEDGSIVTPYSFLHIAKKMHLYKQLSHIVIKESLLAANKLNCDISINITKDDIFTQETINLLFSLIHSYDLIGRVTLELVESEGIEDTYDVRSFLQKAKQHGCLLAIDDFGTGYSNFEYLLRIAVDFIKIDGSLIKNLDQDISARTAVKAIVNFAKSFGVKVVAEFVHKKEIYTEVKNLGIEFAQGYYLHEPSSLDTIIS